MSTTSSQSGAPPQIGPYLCRGLLALGGDAAVWTTETAQGWLAVNIARRPEACDAIERAAEFLREHPHPHLPRLFDTGIHASALSWFATDFVEGRSLDRWVAETQPTWSALLGAALELVDAVGHLHRHGRLHGDLKPGNLVVDAHGHVTLFDVGGRDEARQQITPGFAAPEVLAGSGMTRAAEVWSLGATLHAAFAGEPSLDTRDPVALQGRTGRMVPLPLSAWRVDVPEGVDDLLLDMQGTDPRARPDLAEVARRLAAAIDAPRASAPFAQRRTRIALRLALAEAQSGPTFVNVYGPFGSGRRALLDDLRRAVTHDPCAVVVGTLAEADALLRRGSRKIPVWITADVADAQAIAGAWSARNLPSLVVVWSDLPITSEAAVRTIALEPWSSADVRVVAQAHGRALGRPWELAQTTVGLPRRVLRSLGAPTTPHPLPADAERVLEALAERAGWTPTATLQRALDLGGVALVEALEVLVAEGLAAFGPWSRSAAATDAPNR